MGPGDHQVVWTIGPLLEISNLKETKYERRTRMRSGNEVCGDESENLLCGDGQNLLPDKKDLRTKFCFVPAQPPVQMGSHFALKSSNYFNNTLQSPR